jgi:hypothetical protein
MHIDTSTALTKCARAVSMISDDKRKGRREGERGGGGGERESACAKASEREREREKERGREGEHI